MSDYVPWAPGAHGTPHVGGRSWARYVPRILTIAAMGQAWPMALGTLRKCLFASFPAFPAFPAFLTDSGGPSLPSGSEMTERSKVARMATLRLFAP